MKKFEASEFTPPPPSTNFFCVIRGPSFYSGCGSKNVQGRARTWNGAEKISRFIRNLMEPQNFYSSPVGFNLNKKSLSPPHYRNFIKGGSPKNFNKLSRGQDMIVPMHIVNILNYIIKNESLLIQRSTTERGGLNQMSPI